ncbi:MAG TPA: hypothetical protein VNA30_02295 [Mycobacteriales bacterium]|nr:hypothetical protein [Mycobacteriales bacterium]
MTSQKPLLTRTEVVAVLRQYLGGSMTAAELVQWADDNEMARKYEPGYRQVIANFLFDFSSEVLNGPVTRNRAERWVEDLLAAQYDEDD